MRQQYGIKVTTILNATEKLTNDLNYLCSFLEDPDPEFPIKHTLVYAHAIMTLAQHVDFVLEDLTQRELTEDQELVKLTQEDIITMNDYTEATEEALKDLEELCGISLQNN